MKYDSGSEKCHWKLNDGKGDDRENSIFEPEDHDDSDEESVSAYHTIPVQHHAWALHHCLHGNMKDELSIYLVHNHALDMSDLYHLHIDVSNFIMHQWLSLAHPQGFSATSSGFYKKDAVRDGDFDCQYIETTPVQPKVSFIERAVRREHDRNSVGYLDHEKAESDEESSNDLFEMKRDLVLMSPTIYDFFASDLWYSRELVATVFQFWTKSKHGYDAALPKLNLKQKLQDMLEKHSQENYSWRSQEVYRWLYSKKHSNTLQLTNEVRKGIPKHRTFIGPINMRVKTGLEFLHNRFIHRLWNALSFRAGISLRKDKNGTELKRNPDSDTIKKYIESCYRDLVIRVEIAYRWKRLMLAEVLYRKFMLMQFHMTEIKDENRLEWRENNYAMGAREDVLEGFKERANSAYGAGKAELIKEIKLKFPPTLGAYTTQFRSQYEPTDADVRRFIFAKTDTADGLAVLAKHAQTELYNMMVLQMLSLTGHKTHERTLRWLHNPNMNPDQDAPSETTREELDVYCKRILSENIWPVKSMPSAFCSTFECSKDNKKSSSIMFL